MFDRPFHVRQLAAAASAVVTVGLLSGCAGSSSAPATAAGNSATSPSTTDTTVPATTSSAPTTTSSAPSGTGGGAKCSDLTNAAASAAVGKSTTVKLDGATGLPGLTICDLTIANEVYPIQLAVDTNNAQATYTGDQQAFGGVDLSGVGDKAFSSAVGVETLSGNVDIKVTGPAGPVLSKDYTIPTAIAKAMVSAQ